MPGCKQEFSSRKQANAEGWASEWLDGAGVRYYWCPDHIDIRRAEVAADDGCSEMD